MVEKCTRLVAKILIKIAADGDIRTVNNVETIHLRNKISQRNKILFVNDQNDPIARFAYSSAGQHRASRPAKPYVHPYSTPINRDDGFVEEKRKIESRKVKNVEQRDEPTLFVIRIF